MKLTDRAAERIKSIMTSKGAETAGLRIGVKKGGCAGMEYTLDWAAEQQRFDEVVEHNGVKIVGHLNVPGRLAATASSLYARNLYAFVETLVNKDTKELAVKWDDELVKATCLTRDGAIVHTAFQPTA